MGRVVISLPLVQFGSSLGEELRVSQTISSENPQWVQLPVPYSCFFWVTILVTSSSHSKFFILPLVLWF